ncbi:siroheme synthase CysG [Candidatus Erwinia haradaeae]|uniref:Siroheme synthase n=1 Tax=Candidatus Erwinia haradaeae TaxID=1922217 RepID=A0A451DAL4_9GAMM|nr:siroheme synthase CysG [Candidatus Erwinia haradaeae]VFP83359.1 Siroheme synthase [Candidatus Erwinia haradaeae]
MNYLPLFADLRKKPVLVVGGGHVAARKIQLLMQAGARVQIVSGCLCKQLETMAEQKTIEWLAKNYHAKQLEKVFLVIAATNNAQLNSQIYQDATNRYLLANVVDNKPFCSFIFPSIIDRTPIIIAISSSGTAPVLVRLLREKIEALLPSHLGKMANIAYKWRKKVQERFSNVSNRRHFWDTAFNGLFSSQVAVGNINEAQRTLDRQLSDINIRLGEIILVGAGPGDSGLLTLRGLQVMQLADVVLYDYLVSDEILNLSRRDADRICVGKHAHTHSITQTEINDMLVTLAKKGKRVVRLKGGDPFIFGRGGEELTAAVEAGIPFQVVPGVTAAIGAAAYAGIPLTHRDYAHSVLLVTGHHCSKDTNLDWAVLARINQTLVIYMGSVAAADITHQLTQHGRDPNTPVAVISRGTCKDQKVLVGTLKHLPELALHTPPPALFVIGAVVNLHDHLAWYQIRGKRYEQ